MGFKVLSLTILGLLTYSLGAFAGAGSSGGGAGIEINGHVYTLSEAGLKVEDDSSKPYFLDKQTINAVLDVIGKMETPNANGERLLPSNLLGFFRKAVNDPLHKYQKLSVVNPKLYLKIKSEYQKYVDTLPVKGKFILGAFTDGSGLTSLCPDFFSPEVPLETRAIWLVTHEAIYFLKPNANLGNVLRFEGAVQNFIHSPDDYKTWMPVYDALTKLNILGGDEDRALYIRTLGFQGKKLTLANFVPDSTVFLREAQACNPAANFCDYEIFFASGNINDQLLTDPMTLKTNESNDEDFFNRFYNTRFSFGPLPLAIDGETVELIPTNIPVEYAIDTNGRPVISLLIREKKGGSWPMRGYISRIGETP